MGFFWKQVHKAEDCTVLYSQLHLCWRAGTLKFFEDPSRSARNARGVAAGARPGGRGRAVRAGVRAVRGQEIPDRRPRPSAVRHQPRARALHPKTCVPDGRMRLRPASLAVSEPLVLRASWGGRLAARTYGVRAARLRTFLGAPLACLDKRRGVCATSPFRPRLAPRLPRGSSCGAGQLLEKSCSTCA